jgi:hypothetical protein
LQNQIGGVLLRLHARRRVVTITLVLAVVNTEPAKRNVQKANSYHNIVASRTIVKQLLVIYVEIIY